MDDASAVSSPTEEPLLGDGHRPADGTSPSAEPMAERVARRLAHGKLYATTVGSTAVWPTRGAKLARKFDVL